VQRGILCSKTSSLIVSADTLWPHWVQVAVANDPTKIKKYFKNKISFI
jgi:hypothetical protein